MARLSDIQSVDLKPVDIEMNGVSVHFEIDQNAFTIGWQKRMNVAIKSNDIGEIAENFFELVKEWDIEDDEGEVLPLDETSFDQLSFETFTTLSVLITEALVPNASSPTAKSKASRRRS